MQRIILDTDILSEILVGQNPNVAAYVLEYTAEYQQLSFTSFSVFEILSGLRKRDAKAKLKRAEQLFAQNIEIIPEAADYRLAADIVGDLLKAGQPIGIIDPFIAACAIRTGSAVATGNTDHFSYIHNAGYSLTLVNWRIPLH